MKDDAANAMRFALSNWGQFSASVRGTTNTAYAPTSPDITFMCNHNSVLLLMMKVKASPPTQCIVGNECVDIYSTPPADEPDIPLTKEQIQADLDYFRNKTSEL